ncbi:unnamed protein product [Choristocarpus tenellus]
MGVGYDRSLSGYEDQVGSSAPNWSPSRGGRGGGEVVTSSSRLQRTKQAGLSLTRALRSRRGSQIRREEDVMRENFFTEEDMHELMHSTFFLKVCDESSWLFVEDEMHQPDLGWLLQLWGGYKVTVRFQGEVAEEDAHRMLFQCEPGTGEDYVRLRSRATNTFLYFLGVRPPLTLVAWDRDVMGGDWEDLKLVWLGKKSSGGEAAGDEKGRVAIRSRMKGFWCWNGTRFTHSRSRESATVFMIQRMSGAGRREKRGT